MGKVIYKLFSVALAIVAMQASAAPAPTPAEQRLMSSGARIVQAFDSVSGLKAIVADNGKEKRLFYVTADGNSLIVGNVFDAHGVNVTTADTDRAGIIASTAQASPATDAQLQDIWARAEKLRWIAEGNSKRVVYVFFDPNCPYCKRLWASLRTAVEKNQVQVRWLPVAILRDDSKALAAAVYDAKRPSEALQQMANYQLQPVRISDEVNKNLAFNLLLLRDTGYTGVPTILYRRGAKVVSTMGLPTDQQLAALLN